MELLAPAGNFNQAIVSIKSGCNALYGGIKKWSARSRAVNLTIDEYCKLMKICNDIGISFYLTMNTLMYDEELDDIRTFLADPNIPKPHGILVGDVGLLDLLRTEFPNIVVHASTQFGAYSIQDVLYFQSLGIQRIVLARELTMDEIQKIRSQTDAELEVFVYGNQCIIFSGNCLWGGLTHSGSGHKGCCIGTCNDIFQAEDKRIGDFFWANNIGLYGYVDCLNKIGVDSIKIEGRTRPDIEIKKVVTKFRQSIDGIQYDNDYGYAGFLGGKLPPEGMLHEVNPENTYRVINHMSFNEADYLIEENNNVKFFTNGQRSSSNQYAYTIFKNPMVRNKVNVCIRFGFEVRWEQTEIVSVSYVRANGTGETYPLANEFCHEEPTELLLAQLFEYVSHRIIVNIYESKAKIPAMSKVRVNLAALNRIIEKINSDINSLSVRSVFYVDESATNTKNVVLLVDDVRDIELYYKQAYQTFIFNIKKEASLRECLRWEDKIRNVKIYYRIPYLDFDQRMDCIYELIAGRNVVITRISQLAAKNLYGFKDMYGDFMLNVWNTRSAEWLKTQGITALIAHPEISIFRIWEIEEKSGLEFIIIGASKIPFGYTRACFRGMNLCGGHCLDQITRFHNTYKDSNINLVCDNEFGYRTIFDEDYYVATFLPSRGRKVFGLIGLRDDQKAEILSGKADIYADKEKIYVDGYEVK